MTKTNTRIIAFFLPQFHPIKENDDFWGKGFTEWTNVRKAKPLFKNHYQPRIPGKIGYYNLLEKETRKKQAEYAKEIGIDAFCYWHYFFGDDKIILDEPLKLMLKDGEPNHPFMLAWANNSWTGIWHGLQNETIIEQTYNEKDIIWHFHYLLPYFKSKSYITNEGKIPVVIYHPDEIPYLDEMMNIWNDMLQVEIKMSFEFIGYYSNKSVKQDSFLNQDYFWANHEQIKLKYFWQKIKIPYKKSYKKMLDRFNSSNLKHNEYPVIYTDWDNTPRLGKKGFLFKNFSNFYFYKFLNEAKRKCSIINRKLIFVKSWNEWAEGNVLEPEKNKEPINLNIDRNS